MSRELLIWWLALSLVAVFNMYAWTLSARHLAVSGAKSPGDDANRQLMLWLSAAYVFGCAFRSLLPMIEVPRICLYDVWISRVAVTRTIATVAELCFAAQWALLLREAGAETGSKFASLISRLLVPIVIVAELFCWSAVLTANYLAHALENAHWALAGALVTAALINLWPRVENTAKRILVAAIASAVGYVMFMVVHDVPMYIARWQAAVASGHQGRPWLEGLQLSVEHCIVQHDWLAWREDAVWLSLYFTVAVWISIALVHAPRLKRASGSSR